MQGSRDGGLVLIVEDNRNISEMVGEYLEGRGFEVDYASDGLDGYRLAAENSYDVIVLDLMKALVSSTTSAYDFAPISSLIRSKVASVLARVVSITFKP